MATKAGPLSEWGKRAEVQRVLRGWRHKDTLEAIRAMGIPVTHQMLYSALRMERGQMRVVSQVKIADAIEEIYGLKGSVGLE